MNFVVVVSPPPTKEKSLFIMTMRYSVIGKKYCGKQKSLTSMSFFALNVFCPKDPELQSQLQLQLSPANYFILDQAQILLSGVNNC